MLIGLCSFVLCCHLTPENAAWQGCQIWTKSRSDWSQITKIREFSYQISVWTIFGQIWHHCCVYIQREWLGLHYRYRCIHFSELNLTHPQPDQHCIDNDPVPITNVLSSQLKPTFINPKCVLFGDNMVHSGLNVAYDPPENCHLNVKKLSETWHIKNNC